MAQTLLYIDSDMAANFNIHQGIPTGFSPQEPAAPQPEAPRPGLISRLKVKLGLEVDPQKAATARSNRMDSFGTKVDVQSVRGLNGLSAGKSQVSRPDDSVLLADLARSTDS